MKKYRLCIALVILVGIISSCSVLPASNGPTAIITPIPTKPYIHPSESPTVSPSESPSASPTSSLQPTASADSVMINEQNNFKFGMNRNNVKKELKKLGIKISDEGSSNSNGDPEGFYYINTDDLGFSFNDQNQLYSIAVYSGETVKGLKKGDSVERIQQLYGKPDELEPYVHSLHNLNYMYKCNGYMFSVDIDPSNNTVSFWSVFLNIWNDPNSYGITDAMYASDDSIHFNEENFNSLFPFGMSRKELKKKLTGLGIRIDSEEAPNSQMEDDYGWTLITDHVSFSFDKDHLYAIDVDGWGTAKGLQIGDSVEKLHQLYGQENSKSVGDGAGEYIYKKQGYDLDLYFLKNDSGILGYDSWTINKN